MERVGCVRSFPAFFVIADSKGGVADVWDISRGERAWNLNFVRSFND